MRLLSTAAAPALVFVTVWAFRFLSMGALENDHFVALARAHQMLHGDWPVRDFFDPGQPLAYLTSAAAAALFGPTPLTDVALATTLLALVANIVPLRDVIVTRMPDVIGLVAVLAAWIAGRAISRQLLRTAGIVALALVSR